MIEKAKDDGQRKHKELPELKGFTELDYHDQKIKVYGGLGQSRDIIALGCKPDELKPSDYLSIYVGDGYRILAKAQADEDTHAGAAMLATFYLIKKGVVNFGQYRRIYKDSVRLNVGFDGPDKKFTLDVVEKHPLAKNAISLLTDLGVDRKDIKFNPKEFGNAVY
jgi:hypothetical protein